MNKLKTIGLTIIITAGVLIMGYILIPKDNPTGGAVQNAPTYATASSTVYSIGDDISTKVLDAKSRRAYARICNNTPSSGTTQDIYLSFSSTAITATSSADTIIEDDECYEITRDNLYVGEVQIISELSTTTEIFVLELID